MTLLGRGCLGRDAFVSDDVHVMLFVCVQEDATASRRASQGGSAAAAVQPSASTAAAAPADAPAASASSAAAPAASTAAAPTGASAVAADQQPAPTKASTNADTAEPAPPATNGTATDTASAPAQGAAAPSTDAAAPTTASAAPASTAAAAAAPQPDPRPILPRASVVDGMVEVLLNALVMPGMPRALRAAAEASLATLAAAVGRTVTSYLAPMLQAMNPPLPARRLTPIKVGRAGPSAVLSIQLLHVAHRSRRPVPHCWYLLDAIYFCIIAPAAAYAFGIFAVVPSAQNVEVTISQVQSLTFVARQQPPALPLSEQLQSLVYEAVKIADLDEPALMARLNQQRSDEAAGGGAGGLASGAGQLFAGSKGGPGPRNVTMESLMRLRVSCMQLLTARECGEHFGRDRPGHALG